MGEQPPTSVRNGFVPVIKGGTVDMRNAGALAVLAHADINIREGGALVMLAGGDLSVEQGGAQMMLARGNIAMNDAGAMFATGATVEVVDGWVGIAVGRRVDISNSRVLLGPFQALGFGVGLGISLSFARRIFKN